LLVPFEAASFSTGRPTPLVAGISHSRRRLPFVFFYPRARKSASILLQHRRANRFAIDPKLRPTIPRRTLMADTSSAVTPVPAASSGASAAPAVAGGTDSIAAHNAGLLGAGFVALGLVASSGKASRQTKPSWHVRRRRDRPSGSAAILRAGCPPPAAGAIRG
jgi:hypothetical protein